MSDSNVHTIAGDEPEFDHEAMVSRLNAVALLNDELADFVKSGQLPDFGTFLQDAAAIGDLLAATGGRYGEGAAIEGLSDNTIPHAGYLIQRLMRSALAIEEHEIDRRIAEWDARMDADAAAEDESREGPAQKVATLAFLHGVDGRGRHARESLLDELEQKRPDIFTVVSEFLSARAHGNATLYVDPQDPEGLGVVEQATAAQAHGRHLVVVSDGDPENVRTWLVGDDTAEALRPLAQDAA